MVGDFNALSINWGSLEVGASRTSFDYKLLGTTIAVALSQHIRDPIRYETPRIS